jgi:antitoxin (DNA-binding transcriptional repressor) of toxin-antitoxin stability system
MKSIDLSSISALSPHVLAGNQEPVVVLNNGKTVAAVVPIQEEDIESLLLSINPQFQAILQESQDSFEAEGGFSSAEVRAKLELPPSAKD